MSKKNINLALVILGLAGIVVAYSMRSNKGDGVVTPTKTFKKQSQPNKETAKNSIGSPSKAIVVTPLPSKNSSILFVCSDTSKFTVNYSPKMSISMVDSRGTRNVDVELFIPKNSISLNAMFQSKDGSLVYTSKGEMGSISENGKETFNNCKLQ